MISATFGGRQRHWRIHYFIMFSFVLGGCITTSTSQSVTVNRCSTAETIRDNRISVIGVVPMFHELVTPEESYDLASKLAWEIQQQDSTVDAFIVKLDSTVIDSIAVTDQLTAHNADAVIWGHIKEARSSGGSSRSMERAPLGGIGDRYADKGRRAGGAPGKADVLFEYVMVDLSNNESLWEIECTSNVRTPNNTERPTVAWALKVAQYEVFARLPF